MGLHSARAPQAEPTAVVSDTTIPELAADCRETLLAFLEHGAAWDKRDLAGWLAGPYRHLTRHTYVESERVSGFVLKQAKPLRVQSVASITSDARLRLLALIRRIAAGDIDFTTVAIERDFVRRARDIDGNAGWIPIDGSRMHLVDRLVSILAADCLMRPSDYLALVSVCSECERISFHWRARSRGVCKDHSPSVDEIPLAAASGPRVR